MQTYNFIMIFCGTTEMTIQFLLKIQLITYLSDGVAVTACLWC